MTMTSHWKTAWRNILYWRRQTVAVSLLALFAMTLMSIAFFLGQTLREGLTAAVEPFDMLVGYGGSYQLVLNTVFLQDYPAGNVPYRLVGELNGDPRIRHAIPLAFGDNHRGYRIVGTDVSIFSHFATSADRGPWLRFARGAPFAPGSREAVVGSGTAADLGLEIGDSLVSSHGFVPGGEEHADAPYVVSGILASCRGPYDRAIFVDIRTIWEAHGDHDDGGGGDDHPEESESVRREGDGRQVTAIMVKPAGFADAYQVYAEFNNRRDADLVFPAQVVVRLLSILGQADWLLRAIGSAAGAIAAATIALSLYWSAASREREALIMRLLGAESRDIAAILIGEGVLTTAPGLAAGCLIGHAVLAVLSGVLERSASLYAGTGFSWMDALLALVLLVSGIAGEALAALQISRKTG